MSIVVTIKEGGKMVARSKYEAGFLVDIEVSRPYSKAEISFEILDGRDITLRGKWPAALDDYFNGWTFRTDGKLNPDGLARCGCANEHRTLFITAARLLEKSVKAYGYSIGMEFA